MLLWQKYLVAVWGIFSLGSSVLAYYKCKYEKKSSDFIPFFYFTGSFVWSDVVVFGLFWTFASAFTLYLNDWILFLLFLSVFWAVRSWGEAVYWFNQQFSKVIRNPIKRFKVLKSIFHDDSIWWVFHIYWQCIFVVSVIATIYLSKIWF